jgi:pyrroloquinoline quinone (PQQ) biosynthesis protein C
VIYIIVKNFKYLFNIFFYIVILMLFLTEKTEKLISENIDSNYTKTKGEKCLLFLERIQKELLNHEVIVNNKYTKNWAKGNLSKETIKKFIVQFSVFSNQFLVAQLQKVINSNTMESARESKEILANEIGVIFNSKKRKFENENENDNEITDPKLVSTTGTVDGGTYRFAAAHFEWIYKIAQKLDLEYKDIGRRIHGYNTTLYFCDKLIELYGGDNYEKSVAVSYAIENWAAAGFWKELIAGLRDYNLSADTKLPLSFFTWHDKIEDQHAEHTQEELEEIYFRDNINEDKFIKNGNEILDALLIFWNGLYK